MPGSLVQDQIDLKNQVMQKITLQTFISWQTGHMIVTMMTSK